MKQEEIDIYSFEKGDLITRIKPSKPIPGTEEFGDNIRDRTYIGLPLVFLGIANGCIYVENTPKKEVDDAPMSLFSILFNKESGPINLPLDMWDEGWTYYVDPYKIEKQLKGSATTMINNANKIKLEKELKKALDQEDYELAEEIKLKLKKLEK